MRNVCDLSIKQIGFKSITEVQTEFRCKYKLITYTVFSAYIGKVPGGLVKDTFIQGWEDALEMRLVVGLAEGILPYLQCDMSISADALDANVARVKI
jgi:uncharacterized ion transporter superfamily protein YfcC